MRHITIYNSKYDFFSKNTNRSKNYIILYISCNPWPSWKSNWISPRHRSFHCLQSRPTKLRSNDRKKEPPLAQRQVDISHPPAPSRWSLGLRRRIGEWASPRTLAASWIAPWSTKSPTTGAISRRTMAEGSVCPLRASTSLPLSGNSNWNLGCSSIFFGWCCNDEWTFMREPYFSCLLGITNVGKNIFE